MTKSNTQKFVITKLFGRNVANDIPIELNVDSSGSQIFISHQHSKVHQGKYFNINHYFSAVPNLSAAYVLVSLGSSIDNHAVISINNQGDAKLQLYENPSIGATGTAITIINHNRNSATSTATSAYHTPTLGSPLDLGTELLNGLFLPGGTKDKGGGGISVSAGEQWVFKGANSYLFVITNMSGAAQDLSVDISYYEVP